MNQERVILFDLGKVLVDFDHRIAVDKIKQKCCLSEAQIYNLFFDSDITDRFERGLISPQEFYLEVKKMLNLKISYEEFVPIWNDIFTVHPGILEMLESLKDNYNLYLVSNINKLHFEYLQNKFRDYFKYFTYMFLSYELKLRKPDFKIYKFILDYLRIPPINILYVDDRIELVEAAKSLGFDAFVFKSTDMFKQQLSERGIKFETALNRKE